MNVSRDTQSGITVLLDLSDDLTSTSARRAINPRRDPRCANSKASERPIRRRAGDHHHLVRPITHLECGDLSPL